MTITPTVSLSNPADLAALLPSQLGLTPVESVVLVSLRPPGSRVGLMVRVDLAELAGQRGQAAAAGLTRVLLDDNASAVLLVIYDSPRRQRVELSRLVQPLLGLLRQADLPYSVWLAADGAIKRFEVTAIRSAANQGASKGLVRQSKAPPARSAVPSTKVTVGPIEGASRIGLRTSAVSDGDLAVLGVEPVPPGGELTPFEGDLTSPDVEPTVHDGEPEPLLPPVSPIDKRSARRSARRAWDARLRAGPPGLGAWRLAGLDLFLTGLAAYQADPNRVTPPVAPTHLGRIAALIADPIGRDSVMVATVGPSPDWARDMALSRWLELGGLPAEVNQLLNPMTAPDAPPEQIAAGEAILRLVAAHASAQRRPAVLDLLAWLAWWKGDAVKAQTFLAAAEAGPNEPPLGDLVRAALAAGLLPPPR